MHLQHLSSSSQLAAACCGTFFFELEDPPSSKQSLFIFSNCIFFNLIYYKFPM